MCRRKNFCQTKRAQSTVSAWVLDRRDDFTRWNEGQIALVPKMYRAQYRCRNRIDRERGRGFAFAGKNRYKSNRKRPKVILVRHLAKKSQRRSN